MTRPLPTSTYRLQISSAFDLDAAAGLCGYLRRLGVDWVYLSPLLRAEPGSTHGYDVIDHSTIDPERGGAEAFDRFVAAARSQDLGILIDIVPNHMGVATPHLNAWWWDLLGAGRASRYADAFDVDWAAASDRVRIPVLGDGDEDLARLVIDGDELVYGDNRYPIARGTAHVGDSPADVHGRQHYELVNWRRADDELNYRRFFAVNSLAAIRVEEPWVFDESHREIRRWFEIGAADGLRVDHPDGLADPRSYLDALGELTKGAPVWVEKILEGPEELPSDWRTAGTTGYDALAEVDRVLIDPAGRRPLQSAELSGQDQARDHEWHELTYTSKRAVADGILRSEINRLARLMPDISGAADALVELAAAFPVYRSYLPLGIEYLESARDAAIARHPELAESVVAVARILADQSHPAAVRFQQTTGMVMAKGVEDSAFYRNAALTSLTEVGGDPHEFAISLETFHERQRTRQSGFPASLTTLSTHDTKRGEDVRARISVLAECPGEWAAALERLRTATSIGDGPFEDLLWQAVVGSWPASRERLHGYAEKAAREAGNSTSWNDVDQDFERRMHAAIDAVFDDRGVTALVQEVVERIAAPGWSNALSAKLIQLTAPGIPDVYQGSELWEMSLVDPDNRRAVDFSERERLLARIDSGWVPGIDGTGAAKLLVTRRALRLRREHPERFSRYLPVPVFGSAAGHVVAFDRGGAITIATRLPVGLTAAGGWGDTSIEVNGSPRTDVLTGHPIPGGRVMIGDLLERYPVALLTSRVKG